MNAQKKAAGALNAPAANTNSSTEIIAKNSKKVKPSKDGNFLTMESTVRTLAVKCYVEQLPEGWPAVIDAIRAADIKRYQILAIVHDQDTRTDDIWAPSVEKEHYHIIVRILGSGVKVRTILNLLRVVYRPGEDDQLWKEHGVETVKKFANYAMYLTHETEEAINAGKHVYEVDRLISNLTLQEVKQIREGYVRTTVNTKKVSFEELVELDEAAYKLGFELKDFEDWYFSLSFAIRTNAKMKHVKERYERGVSDRIAQNNDIVRCCIFIQGRGSIGKTYTSQEALKGRKILSIAAEGTGKFDDITATTQALIIDDGTVPNVHNVTDNKMCKVYRRNKDNPWWCGDYVVVTSNKTFAEWAEDCGIHKYISRNYGKVLNENYTALETRFFMCHIDEENKCLVCDAPSTRGSEETQLKRKEMYIEFRDAFDNSLKNYVPGTNDVDYSDLNRRDVVKDFVQLDDSECEQVELEFSGDDEEDYNIFT